MTDTLDDRPLVSRDILSFAAIALLGLLLPGYQDTAWGAIMASLLLLAGAALVWLPREDSASTQTLVAPLMACVFAFYGAVTPALPYMQRVDLVVPWVQLLWVIPIVGLSVMVLLSRRQEFNDGAQFNVVRYVMYAALGIATVAVGVGANGAGAVDIDVLNMHFAAAEDLWAGLNPYTSVIIDSTDPFAEAGTQIVGYVYTPVVLMVYSLSWRIFGDPRWATVLAVGVTVVLLLRPWAHASKGRHLTRVSSALLVVAFPTLALVINRGWTDLLAIPFFLGASLVFRRRPVLAAILLGLGLATKEYFIVLAPLLILLQDEFKWKRLGIAGATVLATYLPFALADPNVFFRQSAALGEAAVRPDSLGLAGLGIAVPSLVSLAVALGVSAWVGRRSRGAEDVWLGAAAVFAVVFVAGFQAFINYWILVAFIVVVALHLRVEPVREPSESEKAAVP